MSHILAFKVGKCRVGNRTAKDVLRCLADYADDDGGNCFPGRETIITEAEINKSSFSAAIRFLESNRFIEVRRRQKNNSNNYRINVARLDQKELYGKADNNSSTENQLSEKPVVRKTIQQLYGKADIGCTKNRTTVVRKTVPDSINTQSITQSYTYTSSEQNSDDLQSGSNIETSEEFTLTSPEENESPEQEETKELTPKQRSIQIGKRCPQEKLVELYHERLPGLPTVRSWNTATRKQNMAARWREMSQRQEFQSEQEGLDFFRSFFDFVGRSPFLMGQVQTNNSNSRPWRADLPWLMKAENFAKVIDRKYHG